MSQGVFEFARHGRALTGASPEHAQIVGRNTSSSHISFRGSGRYCVFV